MRIDGEGDVGRALGGGHRDFGLAAGGGPQPDIGEKRKKARKKVEAGPARNAASWGEIAVGHDMYQKAGGR